MSGKEYPNNWQELHDSPDEMFDTCTYDELMLGLSMWHIPSSHCVIMRVANKDTGKVKEFAYRQLGSARNKMLKLVEDPANEITICDSDTIHIIKQHDDSTN